jgi:F-type H+-transporting ATPase subunit b
VTTLLAAGATQLQFLIAQVLAFVLLAGILGWLVAPMLKKMLGERTKGIEDSFAKMEKETAETAKQLAEMKEKLARFEEEAKRRSDAAAADAEATRKAALAEAQLQAQALLDKAKREIETQRGSATLELAEDAVELIRGAAEEAAKAAMTDEAHRRKVGDYISKVQTLRRP